MQWLWGRRWDIIFWETLQYITCAVYATSISHVKRFITNWNKYILITSLNDLTTNHWHCCSHIVWSIHSTISTSCNLFNDILHWGALLEIGLLTSVKHIYILVCSSLVSVCINVYVWVCGCPYVYVSVCVWWCPAPEVFSWPASSSGYTLISCKTFLIASPHPRNVNTCKDSPKRICKYTHTPT